MAEGYVTPKATKVAFKLETTEGTAPTDTATDSILANIAPEITGFSREWFEREVMIGHWGRLTPLDAGPSDPGCTLQVYGRGSGTHGTAPEIGQMLECSFGKKTLGVAGTVKAATTASTSAFTTYGGAALADEQDILIQVGTSYQSGHITSIVNGTGFQTPTLTGTVTIAPVHGANIVIKTVDDTVTADTSPTTSAFSVATASYGIGDAILVEVTGASGYYYPVTVTNKVDNTTYQTITVTPVLPAAPTTGDDVVVNTSATTVIVCAAPSTTGCTVMSATIAAGQLADIEVSTDTFQTRRILTSSGYAITWWPPVSAAPATGADVYPGVSYIISSTQADYKSGSAFFYFPNGEKAVLSGLKGNPTFTLAIRQPMVIDFAFQGIKAPVTSQTAIAYTWAPPDFLITPPVCLGVEMKLYIPALVKTGTTSTSVLLKNLDGTASYFEATDAVDKLIVDVGSSVYETKTITTWTYSTQTAVVPTLGGTPAAGANAYIERTICVPDTLTLNPGHAFTRIDCMSATDGWVAMQVSDRAPEISWSTYFKSFVDYKLLQQAAFVELWAVLGTTRGNKIAMCVPNLFRQNFELDLGSEYGMVSLTGSAFADGATGNEEMFLTFL